MAAQAAEPLLVVEDVPDVAGVAFFSAPLPDVEPAPLSAFVVVDPESEESLFVPESDEEAEAVAASARLSLR
jgi:hypothetical protein